MQVQTFQKFTFVSVNSFFANNSLDPYNPELWAHESIAVLHENLVMANLVNRDFEPTVAAYGDTINTRKPGTFEAKRKTADDDIEEQAASATNVAVVLDQLVHVSFLLRDAERSKSFKDLVIEFLDPAIKAQAKFLDQIALGQLPQFLGNAVGGLGSLSSSNVRDRILDARNKMNNLKAPDSDRSLVWTPNSETEALKLDLFVAANQVGGTDALTNAALGRKFGFNNYMTQIGASVPTSSVTVVTGAINNASGEGVGDTSLAVDGFSAAIGVGSWITVDGQPYRVASTTGGSTPTAITIPSPGLRKAVADDAVVQVVAPGAVNNSAGYAAGYAKTIAYDGTSSVVPSPGQIVSFGLSSSSAIYTIVQATSTTITLDRPLEASLADDAVVNFGPAGEYNFAFTKNAMSLIVRPLADVPEGLGTRTSIVNSDGYSMRASISHDSIKQGIRVTLDMLCGVKVMETTLGVPILG